MPHEQGKATSFGFVAEVVVGGRLPLSTNGEKDLLALLLAVSDVGSDLSAVGLDVGVGTVVLVVHSIAVASKVGTRPVGSRGVLGGGLVEETNGNIVESRSITEGGKP